MAFLADQFPSTVSFGFVDNNRNRSSTGISLPAGTELAEFPVFVNLLESTLAALSNARLDSATVSSPLQQVPPATGAIPPEAEVERKLVIVMRLDNNQTANVTVPSPIFALEQDGTDEISLADPLVLALTTLLISGPLGDDNGPVTAGGASYIRAERAFIAHRNRGRR